MTLDQLIFNKNLKILLFGGKGGVGKTSCASSTALWLTENLNKRVLIISTDPAHSLGDSLGQVLTPGEITRINNTKDLWGLEINPKLEQSQISNYLSMLPSDQLPLTEELKELNGLNPPGIDEAMAFGKVLEFLEKSDYDIVIFDTAPTGHTLRLLSIPDMLSSWMGKMLMLRLKMSKIFNMFKGLFSRNKEESEDPIKNIERLKNSIENVKDKLMDPEITSFIVVTIPEVMAIYESERLLSSLNEYNIPCNNIIINQLYPENIECIFCQKRREMQQNHVKEIKELYDDFVITEIPLFEHEIRKINGLKEFSKFIFD